MRETAMPATGSTWCLVLLLASTSALQSSQLLSNTGWVFPCMTGRDLALPVVAPLTPLVTTLCAVVALEKELLATTVCGTPFTRLRSKLLLAQLERGAP